MKNKAQFVLSILRVILSCGKEREGQGGRETTGFILGLVICGGSSGPDRI